MVVGEASIHNIMGGMESTGGVRLHNHKRKLKQRFDIIKKLGQGTYGKVQLGINKETGQEVAIKTIKKCKIETEADLIRIRREIQIMSSVQHPNIIHIYEVFENREKMVLVMEYAAGGELYDYLSERKVLSEQEARRIFRQISTAVFYCHKHKICHRDLKLENILLDQIGNAKIADFGLSNVFDEQRLLSTFCGSPLYASPEIVKGTPYHGPEVDCWSLGVLLYTLVYGAMPFDGSNFKRLVKQISQSDYFEPKKPSPASPLIKEMLTVCPTRRADIEKICAHWWVNEDYEQSCLDIAEDLAAQTPVRLDLLLSLVPQSASAEKLVVGDQQAGGDVANNMSSETLVPTRCHSVGSLMELDQNNSDRRIREQIYDDESWSSAAGDSKRKLETTPSMDETIAAGVKRKERSRRKERSDEREPRPYRSASRHHSAPIPNPITEEPMEVDPSIQLDSETADLNKAEKSAACLELIEETKEKSPSKERSKTPVAPEQAKDDSSVTVPQETVEDSKSEKQKEITLSTNKSRDKSPKSATKESPEKTLKAVEKKKVLKKKNADASENQDSNDVSVENVPNKDEIPSHTKDESNNQVPISKDTEKSETSVQNEKKSVKKLKDKALSLDSELSSESSEAQLKPVERRRSKIFETAEKFNQLASGVENDKPKKIFIPGVNVGGAKRAFERKASQSSVTVPQTMKPCASKVIIEVPTDRKDEKVEEKIDETSTSDSTSKEEKNKRDEEKKRAVDIITGAIGKPPMQKKANGSPPISPQNSESKKLGLKLQVGPNDVRTATVSVSTPVETKFPFESKPVLHAEAVPDTSESSSSNSISDGGKKSSKMEITLKSATLPRPRKTSKAEIILSGVKSPENTAFKSEVEAKIDAFHPQKLRTQRSEVAFPVAAAVPQANRSSSLEPEGKPKMVPKERIIPIQVRRENFVESSHQQSVHSSTPPPKPPMPQRSMSQRSGSLSRQSTADSDTDSALGSTAGPEPIRKSPREYIIPIAVEGGGYVTPRSGSVEPESKTSTPTSTSAPRSRFGRPRRMSSLLSDASEDESPFSTLHRDSDDLLQRHMHRLRSSRPTRQPPEHADSLSSGEDDDDDGFELLTAENLFSTLLSRVRSLTQRLNVDDNRGSGFPSSRLLGRLGSNSPQGFWGIHEPLSSYTETQTITTRLSESQFRRSLSRDTDRFGRKDSVGSTNPGTPNSPGARSTPSRDSIFDMGSNTLPREKGQQSEAPEAESAQMRKQAQESLEQNFTPSLARRLSRQFIEQTRQSLPRSPSIPRDKSYASSVQPAPSFTGGNEVDSQQVNLPTPEDAEYRGRSVDRTVRRTNSFLEPGDRPDRFDRRSPRRSVSLFDDEDRLLPPLPRQVMTLGRKYREPAKSNASGIRWENFHNYRNDKIQEESTDDGFSLPKIKTEDVDRAIGNSSNSECNSVSICNSNTNLLDTASSLSAKSSETSPTESTSNMLDYNLTYKSDTSKDFENRLLAAENLIKESKLKNLTPARLDVNLSTSYKDTDKCDKESLSSISDNATVGKRRSCIPSLRLRSGSLTREPVLSKDRRKSFTGSQDTLGVRAPTPERSILSKFFKPGGSKDADGKDKSQKGSGQRRISRFLRPDFFDTPREESQYVKEKEAQKAAENERRKSRFVKKKHENRDSQSDKSNDDNKPVKDLKNEVNSITKERSDTSSKDDKSEKDVSSISEDSKPKFERQTSRNSFLHSLEKKLEKFRSHDDSTKAPVAGALIDQKIRSLRENSAPPSDSLLTESGLIKRAVSVEDLAPQVEVSSSTSKGKVSSVLGLFKNIDTKQGTSGMRPQNMILSKLKKNPYKGSKSDTLLNDEPSTSKIPTKFSKPELKSSKKSLSESKKSPPKENGTDNAKKSPERVNTNIKKPSPEKGSGEQSNKEPFSDKMSKARVENLDKVTNNKDCTTVKSSDKKNGPVDTNTDKKNSSLEKILTGKNPSDKSIDNKQTESKVKEFDDKKSDKPKKTSPLSSFAKNGSASKIEKGEEPEKKVKKVIKVKDGSEKESGDGTKKKKIVRVVKKVVKKASDSSDSKSEAKEKPTKTLIKKITSSKKEKSPSDVKTSSSIKGKEKSPDTQTYNKAKESSPKKNTSICNSKSDSKPNKKLSQSNAAENPQQPAEDTSNSKESKISSLPEPTEIIEVYKTQADKVTENNLQSGTDNTDSSCSQPKPLESRSNRNSLKLDLSKIPQHSFRSIPPSKQDLAKAEVENIESVTGGTLPKLSQIDNSKTEDDVAKLIRNLSKITHHANITGNKIIIDKPLCAKDIEELQKERNDYCDTKDNSSSKPNDQNASSHLNESSQIPNELNDKPKEILTETTTEQTNTSNTKSNENKQVSKEAEPEIQSSNTQNGSIATSNDNLLEALNKKKQNLNLPAFNPNPIPPPKDSPNDYPEELFSPIEDTESFDSWSICSADLNHNRSELHSPTSPTYSPSIRNDQPESIIDRIRRKSFYSRFNDRKRKTSLTAPPPGVTLPASATLPRKFSFNSPREKDHSKLSSYTRTSNRRQPERTYSMYNEDIPSLRKSPVDRDRYTDLGGMSSLSDLRSPTDHYGNLSLTYDPLRKYMRSPTFDSVSPRRRYRSNDFSMDSDLGSYRSPLSSSAINDSPLDNYTTRSSNVIPKKYRSTVTNFEPKTADYYEELLAPSNSEYLTARKSPVTSDYLTKYENGYHNGNLNLPQYKVDKWKAYADKMADVDLTDESGGRLGDQTKGKSQPISESRDLPSTSSEAQSNAPTAE
ncbi:uncharacterized protein LOC107263563 isoform X2 [Cephus cinctus]|uniref:Uncharacterized protein LOC107263563 isoform X2 n=1 Tax=Cephus cinctus TaxID=211228 RepID=A0AAJ7R9M8_CEPCN|nr:uncharacterized protein LOC107263563 isoform X2 [Cephus cinctus]